MLRASHNLPGGGRRLALLIEGLRRIGIAIGSLVAAALVMGLVGWLIMIPMGGQLLASGAGPLAGGLMGLFTIILGGLIYRDIMEREDRAG